MVPALTYRSFRYSTILVCCIMVAIGGMAQSGFPYVYGDNIMYFPRLSRHSLDLKSVQKGLANGLSQAIQVYDVKSGKTINGADIKTYIVSDDRIEVVFKSKRKDNLVWMFSAIDDSTFFFFGKQNAGTFIFLPGVANFGFSNTAAAQQLADNIYALQYPVISRLRDSILTAFRARVVDFRNSYRVAVPGEAQQRLLEKADSLCELDDIFGGIRTLLEAIAIDEMAFPEAYANLALLYAHINFFDYAILYLKQYLMLEPDEVKMREALDKLYEWEGIIYY